MGGTVFMFSDRGARWVSLAVLAIWVGLEARSLRPTSHSDRRQDAGTKLFLVVAMMAGIGGAALAARSLSGLALPGAPWATFSIGVVVSLGGIAFRQWAVSVLGRLFTRDVMIRENHHVVASGPYRVIRHPAYTGTLLTMLGFGVMLGNWLSIAITFAGFVVSHLPRILHEEHVLERNLGEPYRAFEHDRKRLVPGVW